MSVYRGVKTKDGSSVATVDGHLLDMRLDLRNCSSGPAQLALAILAHHFQDDDRVWGWYQEFKTQVISNLHDTWDIASAEIETFIDENVPY